MKVLLNCEDNEGCTPLHYACRLGIHDSVKNMLGLSGQVGLACKSKDKKSALHFAAQWVQLIPEGTTFFTTELKKLIWPDCHFKLLKLCKFERVSNVTVDTDFSGMHCISSVNIISVSLKLQPIHSNVSHVLNLVLNLYRRLSSTQQNNRITWFVLKIIFIIGT